MSQPPVDIAAGAASPLLPKPPPGASSLRPLLPVLLSLCLGLFLADALVSLVDDSLILFFNTRILTALRGMIGVFSLVLAILVYALIGFAPMIPKRLLLPVTLFNPVAFLVVIPLFIYFFSRIQQLMWLISFCQVLLGLGILFWIHGGFKFSWLLFPEGRLKSKSFSWLNLSVFVLVNVFVLLPAVIVYLVCCTALGVDHLTDGFLRLRPGGLTVEARKYVRADGKTIQLFPMSHVGNAGFYREVSQSFPAGSVVLLEGVTDHRHLLTNQISYRRLASSLGQAEQHAAFNPTRGSLVQADVDVSLFAPSTIDLLNLVMLVHSQGLTVENLSRLLNYHAPPRLEAQVLEDLLHRRNRRLLEEIRSRLAQADFLIVPWGVAHMPELAREIQKSGFRLESAREYVVVRFGSGEAGPVGGAR